ncbi:hypothetical protein BDZ90DRAFT_231173 [Jaminaea rosea]|uniref:Uncharacterized protein n=1 Tax=Jaminaea rosea TaxID=1569628 RepID=A0A316UV53_9BASI|nr:hypothetical protein BDZ90DRAFT_231173 [Jaminaea rosea]PWN29186.1 hypothetical protein BDZ90DRAFT_231173 [Jaminaea rosea]
MTSLAIRCCLAAPLPSPSCHHRRGSLLNGMSLPILANAIQAVKQVMLTMADAAPRSGLFEEAHTAIL